MLSPSVIRIRIIAQGYRSMAKNSTIDPLASKEPSKAPDSPETSRTVANQLPSVSPTQSSPQRQSSNGNVSPAHNNSADSVTPPLPASAALSVSLDSSQSQPYTFANFTNCVTRPLVKVKRFLSTLVQFGLDINTDVGERVRSLVLSLVSSNLSIEEFHHSLQEVTNFPLRPFVLPFLKAHLPLLQREIHALSRANKQSPLQYVRTHEHMILDPASSPTEPSEIFLPNDTPVSTGTKRRMSDLIYENGLNGPPQQDSLDYGPIKRPLTSQNAFLFSHQSLLLPNITSAVPNHHIFDYSQQQGHAYAQQSRQDEDINRNFNNNNNINNRGDEEWRNIHTMLNCILTMVEKTKRALTILQQRNNQDATNDWFRRQDVSVDLKKAANEIMLQAVKQTEDRVAEVKRKAEEAVNDVKRQAVIELQKAVTAAEVKANEILASERAKMDKLLTETKKSEDLATHTTDSAENNPSPPSITQPAPSQQNSCWNCGRKAHETCSGCNTARYCGSFCQHKDWDNHHQMCSREKTRSLITTINSSSSSTSSTTTTPSNGCTTAISQQQVTQTDQQIKFKK
ncbi:protein CBFA2T1 [Agrilus planipennis]|uniref:Protein CBFA2T1 n=1 Tax=Agrilus planipennis TaxID=224129 RepID=A0A1W4WLX1_AGRPL|nr:protein CBFA2T1 [Agrilus planipennis]